MSHYAPADSWLSRMRSGIGVFVQWESLCERTKGCLMCCQNWDLERGKARWLGIFATMMLMVGLSNSVCWGAVKARVYEMGESDPGAALGNPVDFTNGTVDIQSGTSSYGDDNIAEFVQQREIDGALVGGASLKAAEFLSMVRQTSEIKGHLLG